MKFLNRLLVTLAITMCATSVRAYPTLQLDIVGGTYDTATQTIMASGNTFSLYAYGKATGTNAISLSDYFYLSMALMPVSSVGGNFGSFTINGTTINATADMTYGTPPLESVLGGAGYDTGDLSSHGIFPAYFAEKKFQFSSANTSALYNTQTSTGLGPQAGTGMYYAKFDFDISGLNAGEGLHFDLYNEKLLTNGDIDVNKFAPFSHDAEGSVVTVPEPVTLSLLALGLAGIGFSRRRKQKAA